MEAAEARLQAARESVEDPVVATDAVKLTAALAEMEAMAQHEADRLQCTVGRSFTEKVRQRSRPSSRRLFSVEVVMLIEGIRWDCDDVCVVGGLELADLSSPT